MRGKDVFRKKRSFDLEKTVKLNSIAGETIEIAGAETYNSKKFDSEFAVIEDSAGNTYFTWSAVVVGKVKELVSLPESEWVGLSVSVVEKTSKNGNSYLDLDLAE